MEIRKLEEKGRRARRDTTSKGRRVMIGEGDKTCRGSLNEEAGGRADLEVFRE